MSTLPDKTVERLSQYRRNLLICDAKGKEHIFSHEIANIHHITPVQVRRDIMLIGYTGTLRKGYNVKELVELIGQILDKPEGQNVAIVGAGNLGRALIKYFVNRRKNLQIVAAFDIHPEKIGTSLVGVEVYPLDQLKQIVKEKNICIGIICVPVNEAVPVTALLVDAKIKGILNYTPRPVNVPENVYLEENDMVTSLEKVAYFAKNKN
ncbi:MAG: redox-sensing transcriptional repressor Rex [Bacteroidales bacterium]|nr:redox-sensing transcriptional repressor Rex [Bacteroidales bacterium]